MNITLFLLPLISIILVIPLYRLIRKRSRTKDSHPKGKVWLAAIGLYLAISVLTIFSYFTFASKLNLDSGTIQIIGSGIFFVGMVIFCFYTFKLSTINKDANNK